VSATGSFATVTSDRWCSRAVDAGYDVGAGGCQRKAAWGYAVLIGQMPLAEGAGDANDAWSSAASTS
jgi:hypothetical protein